MNDSITIRTLTDGGQTARRSRRTWRRSSTAPSGRSTSRTTTSSSGPRRPRSSAARSGRAAARGVAVRFLWNADVRMPMPVPPPPEPDGVLIASLGVPAKAIAGIPDLMHHKYASATARRC